LLVLLSATATTIGGRSESVVLGDKVVGDGQEIVGQFALYVLWIVDSNG